MANYGGLLMQTVERAAKTFFQGLLAVLTVQGVTINSVHWATTLEVAGTAAVISILTSLVSFPLTGSASLVAPQTHVGRHEASEGNPSPPGKA